MVDAFYGNIESFKLYSYTVSHPIHFLPLPIHPVHPVHSKHHYPHTLYHHLHLLNSHSSTAKYPKRKSCRFNEIRWAVSNRRISLIAYHVVLSSRVCQGRDWRKVGYWYGYRYLTLVLALCRRLRMEKGILGFLL